MSPNRKLTDSQNWSISVLLEGNSATEVGSRLSSGFHLNTFFLFFFLFKLQIYFFYLVMSQLVLRTSSLLNPGQKETMGNIRLRSSSSFVTTVLSFTRYLETWC